MTDTAPSPQAITAWKNKADKLVALDAELTAASAKLEKKLKPIREAHEPEIEKLKAEVKKLVAEVQDFGAEHADILFADGSVLKTKVAIITGKVTPGAVMVSGGLTEAEVIESMKTDRTLKGYLDCKWSLAKTAIKKVLANGGPHVAALNNAGVIIAEGFSVTVKGKGD